MRLSLAVALVSGLGVAATSASAAFLNPPVCADPEGIAENFGDSDNWADFSAVSNCNKICKSYVGKCKAFAKSFGSCANKGIGANAELEKKAFCDTLTDKSEKKACRDDVKADETSDKAAAKSDKEDLISFCKDMEADCVSTCEAPIE